MNARSFALGTAVAFAVAMPSVAWADVAVVAGPGTTDPAWTLAKSVYAKESLRPKRLDEPGARALAGEAPAADASPAVRELSEMRAGIKGDDAASRAVLGSIATKLGVDEIAFVSVDETGRPMVTVYLAAASAFDAAKYAPLPPDAAAPPRDPWGPTVASFDRAYGVHEGAPKLATSDVPPVEPKKDKQESRPFYASPWFWGAIGAAAFGGAAVYFATRDNSSNTIHLDLQVPK